MENILTFVRWTITLITGMIEHIIKLILCFILSIFVIIMAIIFPLIRSTWNRVKNSYIIKYATSWNTDFVLTKKVFNLWQ